MSIDYNWFISNYPKMSAVERETKIFLRATSLSRVWQHVKGDNAFGAITAWDNNELDSDVNKERVLKLAKEVKQAGFGYFWLEGFYVTREGDRIEEMSLFIPAKAGQGEKLKKFLMDAAKRWDQESVLYKGEDSEDVSLLYIDGEEVQLGEFHPDKVADYYSTIHKGRHAGRPFTFASARSRISPQQYFALKARAKANGIQFPGHYDVPLQSDSKAILKKALAELVS